MSPPSPSIGIFGYLGWFNGISPIPAPFIESDSYTDEGSIEQLGPKLRVFST
jgi:hypothetical protein